MKIQEMQIKNTKNQEISIISEKTVQKFYAIDMVVSSTLAEFRCMEN